MGETNDENTTAPRAASKRYRAELAHPLLPGRRLKVTASTQAKLDEKRAAVQRLRADLALGLVDRDAALERLEATAMQTRSLAEVYTDYVNAQKTKRARRNAQSTWTQRIAPVFEAARVGELRKVRMDAWQSWALLEGYSAKTISLTVGRLSAAIRRAGGVPPWGTWRPDEKATIPRVYEKAQDPGEIAALLRVATGIDVRNVETRGDLGDLTYRVAMGVLTGRRKSELSALGWDDLDLDRRLAKMRVERQAVDGWRQEHPEWTRPQDPPKHRTRVVQLLHPCAILVLRWQRDELRRRGWYRDDGPVFPADGGAWRGNSKLISGPTWRSLVRGANLPNGAAWVVHSLRHSAASLEEAGGATLTAIQQRAGWGSLAMAERYAQKTARHMPASRIDAGPLPPGLDLEPEDEDEGQTIAEALVDARSRIEAARAAHEAKPKTEKAPPVLGELVEARRRARALAQTIRGLSLAELARRTLTDELPLEMAEAEVKRRGELARLRAKYAGDDPAKARERVTRSWERGWQRAKRAARSAGENTT
jgi:integrase